MDNTSFETYAKGLAERAKTAGRTLRLAATQDKNAALAAIAKAIVNAQEDILKANQEDLEAGRQNNMTPAFLDRLKLTPERIAEMARGAQDVAALEDPVGESFDAYTLPNDIALTKVRVPLGVVLIIYESRPNVTLDAAALCLKSGNATILRGGSESLRSNLAIYQAIQSGLKKAGLPADAIVLVENPDRQIVHNLLKLNEYIDVVIPRGGQGLVRAIAENATIPVIKHYEGICHVYVDKAAEIDMAVNIVVNAKVQRPGVCNAIETLLVHKDATEGLFERLISELKDAGVELRGCPKTVDRLGDIRPATEKDWQTEYLDLILSIKIVDTMDEAIQHIELYGSHHSDAVVTSDPVRADVFVRGVDSAAVYVNASTRFTDGSQFGMGAEIGISTDRLHARGPVGLRELTSYKYVARGNGQIRP